MSENNPSKKIPAPSAVDGEQTASATPATDPLSPIVVSTGESATASASGEAMGPTGPPDASLVAGTDSGPVQIVDATARVMGEPGTARRSPWGVSLEILKLFLVPALILAAFAAGIALLGLSQRNEWIKFASTETAAGASAATSQESAGSWICPMMCVPPMNEPGRCPVCGMELVPASPGSSSGPSTTIQIDPRSRRVAGIRTTVATLQTLSREISGVGEIRYDETRQKTLAAYIDGRIEELKADYTGIPVRKGELLGVLYSPDLYSAQVEYLSTLEFSEKSGSVNPRVKSSNERLLTSSRQRLVELGMTGPQISKLEAERVASRAVDLHAPISGTVIEKLATTGQYVKAGEPIYRLADLGKVWLVLELFPEDARAIRLGQTVTATTQSLGSESLEGTVEFIEPTVDPEMRTVGVRVAIDNQQGYLKPGEFARASLTVPLVADDGVARETVVIPRNSLLAVGQTSLAYVETKPGEFQLRKVKTGPAVAGRVAVLEGIAPGENVVSKSTFLLDAQMQLQGNPSLIDPDKAVPPDPGATELTESQKEEIRIAMQPLGAADRALAEAQVICPVTEVHLGSLGMGTPIKLDIGGQAVFICCEGCRDSLVSEPERYLEVLDNYRSGKQDSPDRDGPAAAPPAGDDPLPLMELPKMELPKMELPKMELPKMELPKMELPKMEPPESESPGP